MIPSSTGTSRTNSNSSSGSAHGANLAVEVITNTAHTMLDWITPLFAANSNGNEKDATVQQQNTSVGGLSRDIEMSSVPNLHDHSSHTNGGSAYADVMISSQSAIAMNAPSEVGSPSATNYCVVCLSKPADSVIQDCGHYCCCAGCILSIAHASPDPAHCACPICRCTITNVLQQKGKPFDLQDNHHHGEIDEKKSKTVAISNVTYTIHDSHDFNPNILRRQLVSEEALQDVEDHPSLLDVFI